MTKISKNCTSFHTIPFHFNSKIIFHPGILFTVYYDSFLFNMDNTIRYIPSTYRHGLTALPVLNSLVCTLPVQGKARGTEYIKVFSLVFTFFFLRSKLVTISGTTTINYHYFTTHETQQFHMRQKANKTKTTSQRNLSSATKHTNNLPGPCS